MRVVVLLFSLVVVLFSMILHECAHGLTAERLGDPTARQAGRITLNPIPHLSLIGSILLPGFLLLMGSPILFGWAKPVPLNPYSLNNPKRDMIWVGLSGPATNFAIALTLALLARLLPASPSLATQILFYGVAINLMLGLFNLIPIPPLDGSRILSGFLPEKYAYAINRLGRFGFIIVIILLMSGVLRIISAMVVNLSLLLTGIPLWALG